MGGCGRPSMSFGRLSHHHSFWLSKIEYDPFTGIFRASR